MLHRRINVHILPFLIPSLISLIPYFQLTRRQALGTYWHFQIVLSLCPEVDFSRNITTEIDTVCCLFHPRYLLYIVHHVLNLIRGAFQAAPLILMLLYMFFVLFGGHLRACGGEERAVGGPVAPLNEERAEVAKFVLGVCSSG